MTEDDGEVRELVTTAVGAPPGEPDLVKVARRARVLRRRRRLAAGVAGALVPLLALVVVLLPDRGGVEFADEPAAKILDVPESGQGPAPVLLDDGTPVFVADQGDEVVVLDARVPYDGPFVGLDVLVVWCETSGLFEESPGGSRFAPDGTYLGGPAPGGLVAYEIDHLDDRRIRVTGRGEVPPRPEDLDAARQQAGARGQRCLNLAAEDWQARWHWADQAGQAPPPAEALDGTEEGRVVVWGTLEYAGTQPPRLCEHTGLGLRFDDVTVQCDGDDAVDTALPATRVDDPGVVRGYQGVLALEVRDGVVARVALTGGVTEYGGSVRRQHTPAEELLGRTFTSVEVTEDGQPRELVADPIEVTFEDRGEEHVMRFGAGCNTFGGAFELTSDRLIPTQLYPPEQGIDRRRFDGSDQGCPVEEHRQDGWLNELFAAGPAWSLDDGELRLSTDTVEIRLEER